MIFRGVFMSSKDGIYGLTKPTKQQRMFPAKKKMLQVRINEDEMSELQEIAAAHGLNVSQYVRGLISSDSNGKLFAEDAERNALRAQERNATSTVECDPNTVMLHNDLQRLRIELSRHGNNFNQMIRVLNTKNNFRVLTDEIIADAKHEAQTDYAYIKSAIDQVEQWLDEYSHPLRIEGDTHGNN
ncbi:Uncharacterized protein conserved in bacteria [Slackia heliotrinireducens]|nr:Uncharacterized protein conserved in bacteria [Slackia heliotrinireducens]